MKNIYIKNEEELNSKINSIKKAGRRNLHIVSDFDKTLSPAFIRGKEVRSTVAILRNEGYLTPDYPVRAQKLFNQYHPIEIDPEIPLEEKMEKMEEWWKKHFVLIIECGLNRSDIQDIIDNRFVELRKGCDNFLKTLDKYDIPFLIFSASGLGDIISMYLESQKLLSPNIYIITNYFVFDRKGKAIDFQRPIIHSFNKGEIALQDLPYKKEIEKRRNVILLGDSLGDIDMIKGLDHDTVIKIGFLNENVEKNLERYKEAYDAVITNDGDFEYINSIINSILG
jgi:5'-nucleotidase